MIVEELNAFFNKLKTWGMLPQKTSKENKFLTWKITEFWKPTSL